MNLNFAAETKFQDFIDIENLGNFSLVGHDDYGDEYIVIVDTWEGQTRILYAGPYTPDIEKLPSKSVIEFQQINYNEKKITSIVQRYVHHLLQLEEIPKSSALSYIRDLKDYMENPIY